MIDDPRLSRRDLLRLRLLAGSAGFATACGWKGGPLASQLSRTSRFNDWVGEYLLLSADRLAPVYGRRERTPEREFPAYSRSRMLPAVQDPAGWALEIGGEARRPVRLTLDMIHALPRITYTAKHHCVEGWTTIGTWTGVPVSAVLAQVEPAPSARYLRFDSFDNGYFNGWDLKSAVHPQTILAYAFNDRPLTPAHGAPLRLYSPIKLGFKMTKYLTRMTLTREQAGGYWEDQGYPWLGGL